MYFFMPVYAKFWPVLAILSRIYAVFGVLYAGLNSAVVYQNWQISDIKKGLLLQNLRPLLWEGVAPLHLHIFGLKVRIQEFPCVRLFRGIKYLADLSFSPNEIKSTIKKDSNQSISKLIKFIWDQISVKIKTKVHIHKLYSQTQRLKQHHFCETFFPEPPPPPGQVEIFSFFGFWNAPNAWANGAPGTVYLSIYNIQDIQRSLPLYHYPLFSNMHVFSLLFYTFLRFWRNKKSQLMHCRLSLPALPISLFCDAFFAQRSRQIDQYSNSIFQTYFCPNSIFHPPCTAYFRPGRGNQGKFLL